MNIKPIIRRRKVYRRIAKKEIIRKLLPIFDEITKLPRDELISTLNLIQILLHKISPFKNEPVNCVLWVKNEKIFANEYNPNIVAPPEMELLTRSISKDGFTQPIVTMIKDKQKNREVIDGFHRNRVAKENKLIKSRLLEYSPIVTIRETQQSKNSRIASTIRHNRARGKHQITLMSDIVVELKNRNWSNEKIAKNLGMDQDEILRLCQITGLSELFSDKKFSKSWDIENTDDDFIPLSDDIETYGDDVAKFRTINTNDEERIFHTHDKWECYKAGLYKTTKEGMTKKQCEEAYSDFLSNTEKFTEALEHIISEWKNSCEHYLTNKSMNRIAWLGQASMCYAKSIPAVYRSGFYLLTEGQQNKANETAFIYLNKWLVTNGREKVTIEEALSGKQMDIY